jgi:hypothetical protein
MEKTKMTKEEKLKKLQCLSKKLKEKKEDVVNIPDEAYFKMMHEALDDMNGTTTTGLFAPLTAFNHRSMVFIPSWGVKPCFSSIAILSPLQVNAS